MKFRGLFISLLLLPIVLPSTFAQQPPAPILLGPSGSYSLVGIQTGSIPVSAGSTECGLFESSFFHPSTVHGLVGGVQLSLPELFAAHFGFSAQLAYQSMWGTMQASPVDYQATIDPYTGDSIVLDRNYRFELTSQTLLLDLLASYHFNRLGISAGAWIGYRLNVETEQTDNITGPGELRGKGGPRVMTEGIDGITKPFGFGLTLAVSHGFPAGERKMLVPQLSARAELLSPLKDAAIHRFTLNGGFAFLFDVAPEAAPPPPPPPVVPPPPAPRLFASIRLTSGVEGKKSEHVTVVRASEVLYRKYIPLLPAIFFDRDSATIPERYIQVPTPDTDTLRRSLNTMGILSLHHHNPDIIGMRMQDHPDAQLTLYGSTSQQESPALASARAEEVREYLVRRWNIPRSRITIASADGPMRRSGEATEDGRGENQRVEFTSNDPEILAPIPSESIVREYTPPSIGMDPIMEAEAGVLHWAITIKQGGELVAHYASSDTVTEDMDLTWHVGNNRIDSIPSPISVELTVEDSTGATVTARDELPIVMERSSSVVEQRGEEEITRISYRLVAFDFNSAEPGAEHQATLREIAELIDTQAHIQVIGYTDRIGSEGYNVELSKRRAESVADFLRGVLRARGMKTIPIIDEAGGIDSERFGNDSPEGRVLSRGVLVVIENGRKTPGE
jgi:outer membrane protein OmpA-like peptidoglycan-associated protein